MFRDHFGRTSTNLRLRIETLLYNEQEAFLQTIRRRKYNILTALQPTGKIFLALALGSFPPNSTLLGSLEFLDNETLLDVVRKHTIEELVRLR